MSLLVHLPLTGNLENKGLANVTVTNSGATVDNNGKIGKCYSFNGSSNWISSTINITDSMSFCTWVYFNSLDSTNGAHIMDARVNNVGYLPIYVTSNTILIGENHGGFANSSYNFSLNTWYHICVVYTPESSYIYINGIKIASPSSHGYNYGEGLIIIGCRHSKDNYFLNGKLNDIRIYDHCLSPKEVKEISKGLIVHYKLDDIGINLNLISSRRSYNPSDYLAYLFNLKENLVEGQTYTFLLWNIDVSHSGKTAEQLGISVFWGGGWVQLKTMNGTSYFTDGHADYLTFTITITASLASGSGASNPRLDIYNSIYNAEGTRNMSIGAIKVEKGNVPTIYDCSGYGNNGTVTGTLSLSNDSPRYNYCTLFNGINSYINIGNGAKVKDSITVSCWGYMQDWSKFNGRLISCTESGGWLISPRNSKLTFLCGIGTSSNTYIDNGSTLLTNITSGWHHFVGTYDGIYSRFYIDGNLDFESTPNLEKTPLFYTENNTLIGAEPNSQSIAAGNYFKGKISDVRIYATALSYDDVKELYDTSAFITDNGTTECYEFDEVDDELSINKNGIMKIGNLYENGTQYCEEVYWTGNGVTNSHPRNANNLCTSGYVVHYENIIPDKKYVMELDLSWTGTWTYDTTKQYSTTNFQGTINGLWGHGTGYILSTLRTGPRIGNLINSTPGSYHYKFIFSIPLSHLDQFSYAEIGTRTDYMNGDGTFSYNNLKIYPYEQDLDTEQTKIGDDYITSNNFIEI